MNDRLEIKTVNLCQLFSVLGWYICRIVIRRHPGYSTRRIVIGNLKQPSMTIIAIVLNLDVLFAFCVVKDELVGVVINHM